MVKSKGVIKKVIPSDLCTSPHCVVADAVCLDRGKHPWFSKVNILPRISSIQFMNMYM